MELRVKVRMVCYPPSSGAFSDGKAWYILKTDKGTAKGEIGWRPTDGELLILDGDWGEYKGCQEFKFKVCRRNIPISARDRLRYVCERAAGVGEAMEMKIWKVWGENWQAEAEPGKISRFKGKTYIAFRASCDDFELMKDQAEAIAWLMSKGATPGMSQSAVDMWGKQTTGIVQSNMYRLAELPHYGFGHADALRAEFGIEESDPRRVRAAVVYAVKDMTSGGATVVSWRQLIVKMSEPKILGDLSGLACQAVKDLFVSEDLHPFPDTESLSLHTDYRNERDIWDFFASQPGQDSKQKDVEF